MPRPRHLLHAGLRVNDGADLARRHIGHAGRLRRRLGDCVMRVPAGHELDRHVREGLPLLAQRVDHLGHATGGLRIQAVHKKSPVMPGFLRYLPFQ